MNTIAFHISDEENKLIHEYILKHGLDLSAFLREIVLDRIEDDMPMDTDRILAARQALSHEKVYDHADVWKELGA